MGKFLQYQKIKNAQIKIVQAFIEKSFETKIDKKHYILKVKGLDGPRYGCG